MTSARAHRPFGITLIALLFLLEAIAALGLAAFLLLSPTGATAYGALFDRLAWPAALSSLLAVPPLLTAGLAGLLFRGLWRQIEWARMAALVISFLGVLLTIVAVAFLAAFAMLDTTRILAIAIALLVCGLAFVYLLRIRFNEPAPVDLALQDASTSQPAASPIAAASPPSGDEYIPYVERMPAAAPPPPRPSAAVYAPPAPVAAVGVAGSLVPPPPRTPGMPLAAAPVIHVQADGSENTVASLAVAPATQQIVTGTPAASNQAIAWLVVRNGPQLSQVFPIIANETLFLGRDPARANALLTDPTVSGLHAQIRQEQGRCVLYDLGSTNGTFLGNQAIQRQPLLDGDEPRLGAAILLFTTSKPL